jgi:RimJ/RimL family protein N-acetyltransferase
MDLPETPRLRFRPFTLDDVDAVVDLFADPYARRFYPLSTDRDAAEGWIRWNLRSYESHGFGLWVIELREAGEFVGDCGITMQETDVGRSHEVGYHVVERFRRRGLATEAALACRDWALDVLGIDFVCSIVHVENVASQRVAERIHEDVRTTERRGLPHRLYFTRREPRASG